MSEISAAQVKELRERTGAAMMDCKKALVAVSGDMDAAIEKLRKDGLAKADKKASRTAAEGTIAVAENAQAVTLVEVNCETDFVANGPDFQAMARRAAELALETSPETIEELTAESGGGPTLDEERRGLIAKIGENMTFRRTVTITKATGPVAYYSHGGRIVAVVALNGGDEALARDLAMHVSAMNPQYIDLAAVPAEIRAREQAIAAEQMVEQIKGKTPEMAERILSGKVNKALGEQTLLGQSFVKDPNVTVEKLLASRKAHIHQVVRMVVGEGIEKETVDFATEVAAAAAAAG